jgi:hypothetical protein
MHFGHTIVRPREVEATRALPERASGLRGRFLHDPGGRGGPDL